jgi:Zn-dependent M28 family amino/carboxypeptidase
MIGTRHRIWDFLRAAVLAWTGLCLAQPAAPLAQDSTDWRRDRRAFEYTRREEAREARGLQTCRVPRPLRAFEDFAVDPVWFRERVAELSGAAPIEIDGRRVTIAERRGAAGRDLARKWMAQQFAAWGFTTSTQTYTGGANFVAERTGQDPGRVLVLSAHFDSVGNAGANDDATGVVAALAVARALAGRPLAYSLRFVGFDQEEQGLIGSGAYVRALPTADREAIIGNIQLEMMGVNARRDGKFHVIDCDRRESRFLTIRILEAIDALGIALARSPACTDRSDHSAFWDAGVPAIAISENFFGGDADPCYHARCDVLDQRLDFDYMARITRAVAAATDSLVGAMP